MLCFPDSERTNVSQQTIRGREKRLRRERFFALLLIHDKGFNITMVDIPTIVITETLESYNIIIRERSRPKKNDDKLLCLSTKFFLVSWHRYVHTESVYEKKKQYIMMPFVVGVWGRAGKNTQLCQWDEGPMTNLLRTSSIPKQEKGVS